MKEDIGWTVVVVLLCWALVWTLLSDLDKSHCVSNDAKYSHTSVITLSGYCRVDGSQVAAEEVGQ